MDKYLKTINSLFINTIHDPIFVAKLSGPEKKKVSLWKHRLQKKMVIQEGTMRKFLEKHIQLTVEINVKGKNLRY